jgi:hypothetical protein
MTNRSVLLLHGSCQVEKIGLILRGLPSVTHAYDIHIFPDYGNRISAPSADLIAACRVFVYQARPFSSLPLFAEKLISQGLGIRMPFVSCDAFWPSEVECKHDPRFPDLPWGRYPYGDRMLARLLRSDMNDESVVDQYLQLDLAQIFRLDDLIDKWYRLLDKLEAEAAIKVSSIVRQNWRTTRLFWDSVHPTNSLLGHIASELAVRLGIPITDHELNTAKQVEEQNFIMKPVHPSLIRYFGLTWLTDNDLYRHLDDPPVTSREWYVRYVAYMRELYAIMPEPIEAETASVRLWRQFENSSR